MVVSSWWFEVAYRGAFSYSVHLICKDGVSLVKHQPIDVLEIDIALFDML